MPRHHEVLPGVEAAGPAARRKGLGDHEDAVRDPLAPLGEEVHALVREDEPAILIIALEEQIYVKTEHTCV